MFITLHPNSQVLNSSTRFLENYFLRDEIVQPIEKSEYADWSNLSLVGPIAQGCYVP